MLRIGPHQIDTRVVLAPMVGVTDQPFRSLCERFGTRLAIAEMVAADTRLWRTPKSSRRLRTMAARSNNPRWVQLVGNDPLRMAEAARAQADLGADIIDINMGCPAKTVCRRAAGSALLRDEALVEGILRSVVNAVPQLPVTLKMRTGWSPRERNAVRIAHIAENCGVRALSVHGRTRECRFAGDAEYDTIRNVVASVGIPVIANGDIDSTEKAAAVLAHTGADAVMIGRAAQGRPWLCAQVDAWLVRGERVPAPHRPLLGRLVLEHLESLHAFHGDAHGVRIARKHIGWYLAKSQRGAEFLRRFYRMENAAAQIGALKDYFRWESEQDGIAA